MRLFKGAVFYVIFFAIACATYFGASRYDTRTVLQVQNDSNQDVVIRYSTGLNGLPVRMGRVGSLTFREMKLNAHPEIYVSVTPFAGQGTVFLDRLPILIDGCMRLVVMQYFSGSYFTTCR